MNNVAKPRAGGSSLRGVGAPYWEAASFFRLPVKDWESYAGLASDPPSVWLWRLARSGASPDFDEISLVQGVGEGSKPNAPVWIDEP